MNGTDGKHVLIVGAGLAGTLLARGLADLGFRVSIFERRSDPRLGGYAGGRSINLALSIRGIEGLKRVGLADRLMRQALPLPGRMMHSVTGQMTYQPYSKNPTEAISLISRGGLNLSLIEAAAESSRVSLHFDQRCLDIDIDAPAAIFEDVHSGAITRVEADLILGADGAFSAVRTRLQKLDRFDYTQSYLEHGYKELHIPPTPAGDFALDPKALHIWPRGGAMMIALPNTDRSFTCTLFWPFNGEHGLTSLRTPAEILPFFQRWYTDAVPLMPTLAADFQANPNGSLVTIRCSPWHYQGKVGVLGDAAHAIVPFFGQGMNCSFEDCVVLLDLLRDGTADLAEVLNEFHRLRKPNADAIADMALENFVEMRDKVGSPAFLHRKQLEHLVHDLFPDRLIPKYNLVSFSTTPYAEAKAAGVKLDAILDELCREFPPGTELAPRREEIRQAVLRLESAGAAAEQRPARTALERDLIDLSPLITPMLAVWPGDTPVSREVLCDIAAGSNITLSTLRATVHLGSHADGPSHYGHQAPAIDRMPLKHYIGSCQVIDATVERGRRVTLSDLRETPTQPRVLLKTGTFPDPAAWNSDFAGLAPELVDAFAALGVITIGIDTPSVDLSDSKDLPAHAAFLRHGMAILEGLCLRDVAPGRYELIAPPLKLADFDASPVRAVLRPL